MPDPSSFTVGLIQMHCSADPDDNVRRAVEKVRSAAKQGARWSACRSFSARNISASVKMLGFSIWLSPFPDQQQKRSPRSPAKRKPRVVVSVFERRARGLYRNTAVVLDADGAPKASIAKCTSRTIRFTTKSFISLRATLALKPLTRSMAAWELSSAGTSGIRKARALPLAGS